MASTERVHASWVSRYPMPAELLTSGISVSTASMMTNPFDVVKVRLQMQAVQRGPQLGMVSTAASIVRNEGISSLWNGITPSIGRGMFYGATRIGLYKPLKEQLPISNPWTQKLVAGCTSGALAATVFNPLDLIKTRLQTKSTENRTPISVLRQVVSKDGIGGLWRGTAPSAARAAILTASQCATYDAVKGSVMDLTGWSDSFGTQLTTSMATGLVTTTATAPVDIVKSRVFVEGEAGGGSLKTLIRIVTNEGIQGLFKGWSAQYLRLGPQTMITFLVMERIRLLVGMEAF